MGKRHWTRIWPELQLQSKDFRSACMKSQDGCTEQWLVLAACLKPQVYQHTDCGRLNAPGSLSPWTALPWMSADTLLCRGFLEKPDTDSFLFCFSQECCKDLVFPCTETCLVMQCPAEVWEKSLWWPKKMDKDSQYFPQQFERKLAWSSYKGLPLSFSKKIRGDPVAIRSFMCLFICSCPSVMSVFCPTKWSPSTGMAVWIKQYFCPVYYQAVGHLFNKFLVQ